MNKVLKTSIITFLLIILSSTFVFGFMPKGPDWPYELDSYDFSLIAIHSSGCYGEMFDHKLCDYLCNVEYNINHCFLEFTRFITGSTLTKVTREYPIGHLGTIFFILITIFFILFPILVIIFINKNQKKKLIKEQKEVKSKNTNYFILKLFCIILSVSSLIYFILYSFFIDFLVKIEVLSLPICIYFLLYNLIF